MSRYGALLERVTDDPVIHTRWLNTLSYLENCGSRKIARCEHPQKVSALMLKHASEEARHAFFLKKLQLRLGEQWPDYTGDSIIGGWHTRRYLDRLDLAISRWLKVSLGLSGWALREMAYLLVTYAIEVRADQLYPAYEAVLRAKDLPLSVRAIILEEEGHLAEMEQEIREKCPQPTQLMEMVRAEEAVLHEEWLAAV